MHCNRPLQLITIWRRCCAKDADRSVRLFFFYGNAENCITKIYAATRYADVRSEFCRLSRIVTMESATRFSDVAAHDANRADQSVTLDSRTFDLSFLPQALSSQCQALIESYHELHGYACLPDMLWKAQLGGFIEMHPRFRQILKKASATRSAKKSNQGFVEIATAILSLEILTSDFARWSAIFPEAKLKARTIVEGIAGGSRTPLMECYLYPAKNISTAAIAALAPPPNRQSNAAELYSASIPELSDDRLALPCANTVHTIAHGKSA